MSDAEADQRSERTRAPAGATDVGGLRLRGVTARPGGVTVLRDVDLEVPAGSTTTVIGPSGAGKTTLLRVVAGLTPASSGTVELDGRDLTTVAAHRRGVAVVFQEPRLFPDRTVADNVAFGLELQGVDADARRRTALDLLDRVGLGGTADRAVTGLSGGEQQRVNLARALAVDPALLLLDEPLSAVDPDRRDDLRRLVLDLTRDVTCVHVTHDREEAAELGDRVAVVLEGRLVQHAAARDLFERPASTVVARMVGASTVLTGDVLDGRLHVAGGAVAVDGPDGPATVVARPEQVLLGRGTLHGTVVATRYLGGRVRVEVDLDGATAVADVAPGDAPAAGATVTLDLDRAHRLPPDS